MDYLGPSRAKARAGANAWSELTAAEEKRIHNDKPECKRIVECLKHAGPTLEAAAHRILVSDWKADLLHKAQIIGGILLVLLLIGGYALVYRVIDATGYAKAAESVYSSLRGGTTGTSVDNVPALHQPFPLLPTPRISDPGPPGWA